MGNVFLPLLSLTFLIISVFSTNVIVEYGIHCKEDTYFKHTVKLIEIDPFFDDELAEETSVSVGSFTGNLEGTDSFDGDKYFEFGLQINHNCTAYRNFVTCTFNLKKCRVGTEECKFRFRKDLLELDHLNPISSNCHYVK